MKSFRNPEYLDRYEDVVFDLEQALATPGNGAHQTKVGHRFVADNTGEATPFDWYNARFSVDFKVNQLAAGANICLLYTSPSPRDGLLSRMPSSA